MKHLIQILIVALTCLVLSSCQKELFGPIDESQVVSIEPGHRQLLSKWWVIEHGGAFADTVSMYELTYDSLWRVQQLKTYFLDTWLGDSLFCTATYSYIGNSRDAYKKEEFYTHVLLAESTVSAWYFYDNMHRLMKDSVIDPRTAMVSQYTYSPVMMTALRLSEPLDTISTSYIRIDTGYINNMGNVTRLYTLMNNQASSGYDTELTYDNKRNPFFDLNIHTCFNPLFTIYDFGLLPPNRLQKNNLLNITASFTDPIIIRYNYTYQPNGYPQSINMLFFFTSPAATETVFVYLTI